MVVLPVACIGALRAAAGCNLRALLQRQSVGVHGGLKQSEVVNLDDEALQCQFPDTLGGVGQDALDQTLRIDRVVFVHVLSQVGLAQRALVLDAGVVLTEGALDLLVCVLCQIQFQCHNS